ALSGRIADRIPRRNDAVVSDYVRGPRMPAHSLDSRPPLRSAGAGRRAEMDSLDVLIVGGGPAGSSCAWKVRRSGLTVGVLDKQTFPRNKVCGGWITPAVLEELDIEPAEYAQGRV